MCRFLVRGGLAAELGLGDIRCHSWRRGPFLTTERDRAGEPQGFATPLLTIVVQLVVAEAMAQVPFHYRKTARLRAV